MEQQIISNLPRHLLDIPAFFAVKPNKVPKVNDWGNPKNQKSYKDVRGLMGFDITKAGILVFDFDNALDKDGNWRNDKVKSTFERIMQLNPYSEISISNKGIHIAVKPTKGKFDKITNAGANVLYFDDDHKAKDCPKLEIFYGSKARYIQRMHWYILILFRHRQVHRQLRQRPDAHRRRARRHHCQLRGASRGD